MSRRHLATSTTIEVGRRPTVVVPLGSTEQHGPHLPLDTDTVVAQAVAEALVDRLEAEEPGGALLAPAVAYGSSGEHQSFAGTVSLGGEALRHLLVELVRSLRTWAGRVVLVNGHGGNLGALTGAVEQLRAEGHDLRWTPCAVVGADAHAGRTETSLMLHLRPASVHLDRVEPGNATPVRTLMPLLEAGGVEMVSANGILGDPRGASAEEGAALLAEMAELAHARASAPAEAGHRAEDAPVTVAS